MIPTDPQAVLAKLLAVPGPSIRLSGRYKLTVRRHGLPRYVSPWFDNLILDEGLDYLGTMSGLAASVYPNGPCGYAHIGTGTSTPVVGQTHLDNFFAGALYTGAGVYANAGSPSYTGTATQFYTFAQGALVGVFTEVGISRTLADGGLFSRALILDSNGVPSALQLESVDQLTIAYSLSIAPNLGTISGVVPLGATSYNYSAYMTYAQNIGNCSTNLKMPNPSVNRPFMGIGYTAGTNQLVCAAAGTPLSSTVLTDSTISGATSLVNVDAPGSNNTIYNYIAGAHTSESIVTIDLTQGNLVGGIQSVMAKLCYSDLIDSFRVLYYFANPIPKTSQKIMKLAFASSWSR